MWARYIVPLRKPFAIPDEFGDELFRRGRSETCPTNRHFAHKPSNSSGGIWATRRVAPTKPGNVWRQGEFQEGKMTRAKYHIIIPFLLPAVLLYVVFVIYPYAQAIYISLTKWRGLTPTPEFIGLENFSDLFGDKLF